MPEFCKHDLSFNSSMLWMAAFAVMSNLIDFVKK